MLTAACHCHGCQKMTGGAFSLGHAYARSDVVTISGETMVGALKGPSKHYLCADCGSWVYSHPEGLDDVTVIRSPMLDPMPADPPFMEVFRSEGFAWAQTGATHSFSEGVEPGAFGKLIEEFQVSRS